MQTIVPPVSERLARRMPLRLVGTGQDGVGNGHLVLYAVQHASDGEEGVEGCLCAGGLHQAGEVYVFPAAILIPHDCASLPPHKRVPQLEVSEVSCSPHSRVVAHHSVAAEFVALEVRVLRRKFARQRVPRHPRDVWMIPPSEGRSGRA